MRNDRPKRLPLRACRSFLTLSATAHYSATLQSNEFEVSMGLYRRIFRSSQVLQVWAGVATAVYVLAVGLSAVIANHAHALGLDSRFISRTFLPALYRAGSPRVRADIFAGDFHAGLVSGVAGSCITYLAAIAALLWLASVVIVHLDRSRPMAGSTAVDRRGKHRLPVIPGTKRARAKVLMFRSER
jgi:hypothetical protein